MPVHWAVLLNRVLAFYLESLAHHTLFHYMLLEHLPNYIPRKSFIKGLSFVLSFSNSLYESIVSRCTSFSPKSFQPIHKIVAKSATSPVASISHRSIFDSCDGLDCCFIDAFN